MVWRVRVLAHALRDARLRVPARELQGVFPAEFSPVAGVCGFSQTNTEIWIGKGKVIPFFPPILLLSFLAGSLCASVQRNR